MSARLKRPEDDNYYVAPWSDTFLQGDLFDHVPLAVPAPPDAVLRVEGERRFLSGPFEAGPAMLLSPSCTIAAQGSSPGAYAMPHRTLVPVRPVRELLANSAISEENLGNLRSDRMRNYIYLPPSSKFGESAALLYMSITVHHDVIAKNRFAQLTGAAYWHLRVKLMAYAGGFLLDPAELGKVPADDQRTD